MLLPRAIQFSAPKQMYVAMMPAHVRTYIFEKSARRSGLTAS